MDYILTYSCKFTKSYMKFMVLDETTVYLVESFIDTEYFKLFIELLKQTINKLEELKYKYIYQNVTYEDYEIIKDKWELIEERDDYIIVKTNIESAYENILHGFCIN